MAHRIEIAQTIPDSRARTISRVSPKISEVGLVDVYTLDRDFSRTELDRVKAMLANPVFQDGIVDNAILPSFDYAVEIGYLPGVTDNIGNTARESVSDLLGIEFDGQGVFSSRLIFLSGDISREDAVAAGNTLANPLILRIDVKSHDEYLSGRGMGITVPRVRILETPGVSLVGILDANDEELITIGKKGIANSDGSRRGPLALDLTYMGAIRDYFKDKKRNPTDIELETIAQTWSEHCKHTIFASPMDKFKNGLYKELIQGATQKVRLAKGDSDICVSVFTDNSGAIRFDENYLVTDKAETHNSPSALDPYRSSLNFMIILLGNKFNTPNISSPKN